jgi:hypothetical protein
VGFCGTGFLKFSIFSDTKQGKKDLAFIACFVPENKQKSKGARFVSVALAPFLICF